MLLGAPWDGQVSRFEFQNGSVIPVSSGGDGWLIPEYPAQPKAQGDVVKGAIYR